MDEIQQNEFEIEMRVIAAHYGELLMKMLKQARSLEEDNGAKRLQQAIYEAFAMGILAESKGDMGERAIADIWGTYISMKNAPNVSETYISWTEKPSQTRRTEHHIYSVEA